MMEFDNVETVKRAVEIDAGISIVPLSTVLQEVAKQTLAQIELDDSISIGRWRLSLRKNKVLSPAMKQFLVILKGDLPK